MRLHVNVTTCLWAVALAAPSVPFGFRYLGAPGAIAAVGLAAFAVLLTTNFAPTRRTTVICLVALSVAVAITALFMYPRYGAPTLPHVGSDRDDAINVALERLLAGNYPYSGHTYLGNPLTPLPGSLILAFPSYLVTGTSGYAALYLVPLALWLMMRAAHRSAFAIAIGVGSSVWFWQEIVTGGDLATTSLLQMCAASAVIVFVSSPTARNLTTDAMAFALLAVVCTTRPNSLLVLLLALALAAAGASWRRTALRAITSFGVVFLLVAPFWLVYPRGFGPMHVSRFVGGAMGAALMLAFTFVWGAWWLRRTREKGALPSARIAGGMSVWSVGVALIYSAVAGNVHGLGYASFAPGAAVPPAAETPRPASSLDQSL